MGERVVNGCATGVIQREAKRGARGQCLETYRDYDVGDPVGEYVDPFHSEQGRDSLC